MAAVASSREKPPSQPTITETVAGEVLSARIALIGRVPSPS